MAALLGLVQVRVVEAHALLLRSEPGAGAVIASDAPPRLISLWFSERVTASVNSVGVLDAGSRRVDRLDARVSADDPTRLDVNVGDLSEGAYVVRWQATSADNHVVRGSYWFAVGFAAAPPPGALQTSAWPTAPGLEVVGRWLVLVGALTLTGGALFGPVVVRRFRSETALLAAFDDPRVRRRQARMWLAAGAALAVGQMLWAVAQAESVADLPLPEALPGGVAGLVLLSSAFGLWWWARMLFGLSLAGVLASRRGSDWLPVGLSGLLLLAISLGGHAAAARALPVLATLIDVVHLGAAGLWLGGLAQVGILLPAMVSAAPESRRGTLLRGLVPRVSNVALGSVAILIGTGLFGAWEQVASLAALAGTPYGQSLLLKLSVLAVLLSVGSINLLVVRPRSAALGRAFRRLVLGEVVVGGGLLLTVGLLSSLPPPGAASLPSGLEAVRLAGDLRVGLAVEPNWVGASRYRVTLADARGQPPLDVQSVVLTFAMDGMNMGRTTVFPAQVAQGVYEVNGFFVGMPGTSLVGVGVSRPSAADESAVFQVEVPDVSYKQFAGLAASLGLVAGEATRERPDVSRGEELYAQHCQTCHGETGVGNGPAAASLVPPPSDLTLHARWHPDEQLDWFISRGVAGTAMPGWADQLDARARGDVIGYLHTLANASTATPLVAPAPAAPAGAAPPLPATPSPAQEAPLATAQATSALAPANAVLKGRLAFGPDTDGNLWVWQFPVDKPERLTTFGPGEFTSSPAWSPDGQKIAFSYYKLPRTGSIPIPDGTDLYLVDADGRQSRLLAAHDARGAALQYPVWSPDGASLYVSYRQQGNTEAHVDRVDVESGGRFQLVADAGYPTLSRDGRRLAYASSPYASQGTGLWWSAPDGSDPHQVLGPGVFLKFFGLRLSPDGHSLLFAAIGTGNNYQAPRAGLLEWLFHPAVAHADGEIYDLWTIDLDGRNLRRLTSLAEDLPISAWAPDGRHIVFLGGGSASKAEAGLAVIDPDGSNLRRLTSIPGHRGVDWTAGP